jgi:RimJ/RimL family protein N-acetyltransferase
MTMRAVPFPRPPLAGDGFLLRPLRESDYDSLLAGRDSPGTAEWVNTMRQPDGPAMVRFAERMRRAGRFLHLAIADEQTEAFLGEVVLFVRTPEAAESDTGEIAYVVAPQARGRGLAPAAVRLLSDWAFDGLGLARLQLSIHPDNVASRRVAEKTGYRYEGTLRSAKLIRGRRVDSALFSLLPGDAER